MADHAEELEILETEEHIKQNLNTVQDLHQRATNRTRKNTKVCGTQRQDVAVVGGGWK